MTFDPKADLFQVYVKNHHVGYTYYGLTAVIFIFARLYMYGPPSWVEMAFALPLFLASALAVGVEQDIYRKYLKKPALMAGIAHPPLLKIAACKFFCVFPWLVMLFHPLEVTHLYYHVLGYIFVFATVGIYVSSSAAFLPLFLFDVLIPLSFALLAAGLNMNVAGIPIILAAFVCLALYAFFLGQKIRQSAIELVEKKGELAATAEKARRASLAKSDFVAFMSHEIRTPMTGIFGMLHFLKETPLTPQQRGYLDTISGCSNTLMNTLNDALDLSKIEAGKITIRNVPFSLPEVAEHALAVVGALAAEKKIVLKKELLSDFSRPLKGDPDRLRQVILNLLTNALKFTEKGAVTLRAERKEKGYILRIEVEDTGMGLGEEEQKKLFQKFFQAKTALRSEELGFGLGLSICKALVGSMGGRIGLESQEGRGTKFWFEIPCTDAAEAEVAESAVARAETPPLKVLLVEDNAINQEIARKFLERGGHQVVCVASGTAALAAVQNRMPDIIFMDINLPDMKGTVVAEKIRQLDAACRKIPIIALTANVAVAGSEEYRRAGIIDHLLKPFDPGQLDEILARHGGGVGAGDKSRDAAGVTDRYEMYVNSFGPDYAEKFFRDSFAEIAALMEKMDFSFRGLELQRLSAEAHDLKSVSGTVGLEGVMSLAGFLEEAATRGARAESGRLLAAIRAALKDSGRLR